MHGCSLENSPLVNAEVDSMGGFVDNGVKVGSSAQRSAFEKAQAELRREFDVREERKRLLEFLEEGGNPLDFKLGNPVSVSVQSTSLTDQPPEQFVTSESRGSFADSVQSSGQLEAPVVSEPNFADNILLFNGENDRVDGGRDSVCFVHNKFAASEQTTQFGTSQNAKESDESAGLDLPKRRAYKRRNRSQPNRDGVRSNSLDIVPSQGQEDVKGSALGTENLHDQNESLNHDSKPTISNGIITPSDMALDNGQAVGPREPVVPNPGLDRKKKLVSNKKSEDFNRKHSEVVSKFIESEKRGNQTAFVRHNGYCNAKNDEGRVPNEGQNCTTNLTTKGLDSKSNCTGTCLSLDGTSDSVPLNGSRSDDFHKKNGVEILISSVSPNMEIDENVKAKDENKAEDKCCSTIGAEEMKIDGISALQIKSKLENLSTGDLDLAKENVCSDRLEGYTNKPTHDNPSSEKEISKNRLEDSSDTIQRKVSTEIHLKVDASAHEDSILEEAQIIKAKRKRIAELSVGAFTVEYHQTSHWDFVLEEMSWLANDFAQERLWKISAAAQLSHLVSSTSRARVAEKSSLLKQKKIAHTLSKAIMEFWLLAEELSKGTVMQCPRRNSIRGVQEYAVRYLKYNTFLIPLCSAEAPATPERIYDLESQELSWEEQFTEEILFYTVPPGVMETYRKATESHLAQIKRSGISIQEEVETSTCDAAADHGSQGNAYEEDEGERNTNLLCGDLENGKPSKFEQKKRNLIKISTARSSDVGNNPPFMQHRNAKRAANNLQVSSIPTKRMRTASRSRFTTPFTAGAIQVPSKVDASSGDTNSFQDNMEVESVADFERQLPFDSAEVSKPEKKKLKHSGSTYEQRRQLGSDFQNELGGYSRKRFDKLLESNGSNGLYSKPIIKKQKMIRQPVDNSLDSYSQLAGSIPSPVASQMSNMSNSNKLVKILGGRDRGRKSKSLKFRMPVRRTGPGSPWSSFEEQALIVLVHDLGPNWELISDAINNILQYKCIFRVPKECSEHHKELISRTAGDGADSAEDSGSSQPYPSTLPGIPKGSARALFQRLQEPIEEDMIKFHFEKIIVMTQKLHYVKMQNENREQKPMKPHSSYTLALSQIAGPLLTPIDLCDTPDPSPDVLSGGYQETHNGGDLAISNHGIAASMHPTCDANSALQGSPNMLGNNFSSPPAPINSSMRDGRYGVPRSASLSVDEHQRVPQYNKMIPARSSGTPTGTDRGVRMMSASNMGIMSGMNRNMAMARHGFNSGSMLPSNMALLSEPPNMLRPQVPSNMMRPAQIQEHQRQMMVPDLQIQSPRVNIQGVSPFESFSNQKSYPQQSHVPNNLQRPHLQGASAQHQGNAIRLAKERHLQLQQQRSLQHQAMPRGPPQSQASRQNSSHVQPSSPSSSSMPQQKPHMPPHGSTKIPQAAEKQRQKLLQHQLPNSHTQASRHHPQQRPHPQQNATLVKGAERGNLATHQNINIENPTILNGLSPGTSSQSTQKAEQVMSMMQGQGLHSHHPSN